MQDLPVMSASVVVGIDGSRSALDAALWAVDEAGDRLAKANVERQLAQRKKRFPTSVLPASRRTYCELDVLTAFLGVVVHGESVSRR